MKVAQLALMIAVDGRIHVNFGQQMESGKCKNDITRDFNTKN